MTSDFHFYPLLSAILVFICYIYYLYIERRKREEEIKWKKRLNQLFKLQEEERREANLLIKKDDSSEFFFQSKLQKIEGLNEWLQQAGLKLSPLQFSVFFIILGLIFFLVLHIYFNLSLITSSLIGIVFPLIIAWGGIAHLRKSNRELFLREFPIALDIIRRSLRAGFSTEKALEIVAEQQKGIIGNTFKTICDRMRLGENIEIILADMSNRIGVNEFRFLAIIFVLQRETGGSLADSAENLSKVIRAREQLRKKVKSLTAEVRTTAAILTSLPFISLLFIYLASPKYLEPLFTTQTGNNLLIMAGVFLFLGTTIIFHMTHKELY